MIQRRFLAAAALAMMLAGCSDEPAQQGNASADQAADSLKPGEYEVTAKVDDLKSTDKTTPATGMKAGSSTKPLKACVTADGRIAPEAFAEGSDQCKATSAYVSGGRIGIQLTCDRKGHGQVMEVVDGTFKADSFNATVTTNTYFAGSGDYSMKRTVEGKWTGQCAAKG